MEGACRRPVGGPDPARRPPAGGPAPPPRPPPEEGRGRAGRGRGTRVLVTPWGPPLLLPATSVSPKDARGCDVTGSGFRVGDSSRPLLRSAGPPERAFLRNGEHQAAEEAGTDGGA